MSDIREPTLGQKAAYYLADRSLPGHKEWIRRDVASSWWPWRSGLRDSLFIALGVTIGAAVTGRWEALLGVLIASPLIVLMRFYGRRKGREVFLRRHGIG